MTAVDELRRKIAAQQVTIVVGSGVTVAATDDCSRKPNPASWVGLVETGIQRCLDLNPGLGQDWKRRALENALSGNVWDLILEAERITLYLGGPSSSEFGDWLKDQMRTLKVVHREVPEALLRIGTLIVTTNYDSVLEEIFNQQYVVWTDKSATRRVLKRELPGIYHIHGHYEDPESVVFGLASYQRVISDDHAQTVQRVLDVITTLLFVGSHDGLLDPNLGGFLRQASQYGGVSPHYVLVREQDVSKLEQDLRSKLINNVKVVSYGSKYSDLAPFLRGLVPMPNTTTSQNTPPSVTRISPCLGPPGQWIYVHGENFEIGATFASVANCQPIPAHVYDSTQLGFNLPLDAVGKGPITVQTPSGSAHSKEEYEVGIPKEEPKITRLGSSSGRGGDWLYVFGMNFVQGKTTIEFHGITIQGHVYGPDQLAFSVPDGISGPCPIKVTTQFGNAVSQEQFTVV